MFIDNKYYRYYIRIIDNAKEIGRPHCYYERHHIIPKSMGGGNYLENLVEVSPKCHFILHWLLTRCVATRYVPKMQLAFGSMARLRVKRRLTATQYARAKEAISRAKKGRPVNISDIERARRVALAHQSPSVETRAKMSLSSRGRIISAEARKKISVALRGVPLSPEHIAKLKNKIVSTAHRNKIRIALKGRPRPLDVIEKIRVGSILREQRKREARACPSISCVMEK